MGKFKNKLIYGLNGEKKMDIKIATPKDMKVIKNYITEQNFYKSNTSDTIKKTFLALIGYGMSAEVALDNIEAMIYAISDEYGEIHQSIIYDIF